MDDTKRVFIVEDHALVRAGLRALLAQEPNVEIVGEAHNGRDALHAITTLNPHLVLMDIAMPDMDGIETMMRIKQHDPETRVLVLTMHKASECIHESLRAGADGYILKDATHDEFRVAIRSILNGKTYLSPEISGTVVHGYLKTGKSAHSPSSLTSLTQREREVLKLVAEGHPNRYISTHLCLSIKTVEKHRSNLMKKLDLHNAALLTSFAIKHGLLTQ